MPDLLRFSNLYKAIRRPCIYVAAFAVWPDISLLWKPQNPFYLQFRNAFGRRLRLQNWEIVRSGNSHVSRCQFEAEKEERANRKSIILHPRFGVVAKAPSCPSNQPPPQLGLVGFSLLLLQLSNSYISRNPWQWIFVKITSKKIMHIFSPLSFFSFDPDQTLCNSPSAYRRFRNT